MTATLAHASGGYGTAQGKALKSLDNVVNLQARMMAYNDVFWFLGMIFVVALPLVLLLRGTRMREARS